MEHEGDECRLEEYPQWGDLTVLEKADLITLFILLPLFLFPAMAYMVIASP